MGSFYTNVHVRITGDRSIAREGIVSALRELARQRGMVDVATSDADRTLAITSGRDWISVYDSETEARDPATLRALAGAVARAAAGHAVSILVHDSDVVDLRLFDAAGDEVDRFVNKVDYFGPASPAEKRAAKGRPELWQPVLAAGADESALRKAWKTDSVFVDQLVSAVARVLGIDAARATTGFRYLDPKLADDPASIVLRFRLAERPAWEVPRTGPPRFEASAFAPAPALFVGAPLHATATARNAGGAMRGLSVVVRGSALDRGLVAIDGGELLVGRPARRNDGTTNHQPLAFVEERVDGSIAFVARVPDAVVPAAPSASLEQVGPRAPPAYFEALAAGQVHVNVRGRGLVEGTGALEIALVPHEHRDAAFVVPTPIEVRRAGWRPLRALPGLAPRQLEELQARDTLFAMVTLDVPTAEAAIIAADALAKWAPLLKVGRVQVTRFPAIAGKAPKTRATKKIDVEKLRPAFGEETLVELATDGNDGFSFGRSLYHALRPSTSDPDLPTLAFWLSAKERAVHELAHARELAVAIVDDAFVRGKGTQAIVARAGRMFSSTLDLTAYETACGIGGQCTLRKSWQTRWVRTIAPGTLWVGPALAGRVEVGAAAWSPIGEGHRAVVEDVGAIEQALADVLPDRDAWSVAACAMYAR